MSYQIEAQISLLGGAHPVSSTLKSLTVDNTTVQMDYANFNSATDLVLLTVEAADVRASFDGQNVNTTFGHLLYYGQTPMILPVGVAKKAKFSRQGSTNGVVHYSEWVCPVRSF